MRFRRLELRAFGAVDGRSLDLGADNGGLHVVLGDNEAGKSTCLRAIRGFLFGIEDDRDRLGRKGSELRIVGEVEAEDESVLHVARHKGRKDTLRFVGADGRPGDPVDPAVWARAIGGLDRGVFDAFFGLDDASLREGAEDLLREGGGIGSALFGASVGTRRLQELSDGLRAQREALFKPRGQVQRVAELTSRLAELEEAKNTAVLTVADFEARQDALREASTRLEEQKRFHDALTREQVRLESERRLRTLRSKRESLRSQLRPMPELPPDFPYRSRQTVDAVHEHELLLEQAVAAKHEAETETEALNQGPRDTALLEHRDRIQVAIARLQTLGESLESLGVADFQQFVALDEAIDPALAARFDEDEAERFRQLVARGVALDQEKQKILTAVEKLKGERSRLVSTEHGAVTETAVASLRRELDLARRGAVLDDEITDLDESIAVEGAALRVEVVREFGWDQDPEVLAVVRWPEAATVRSVLRTFVDAERDTQRAEGERFEAAERKSELEQQIEREQRLVDLPEPEVLERLRSSRNSTWRAIRSRFLGGATDRPSETDRSSSELVADFESAQTSADQLADRLRTEAEAVQSRRELRARLLEAEQQLAAKTEALVASRSRCDQSSKALSDLCSGLPGELPEPDVFEAVVERRRGLSLRAAELCARRAQRRAKADRRASLRQALVDAWSGSGLPGGLSEDEGAGDERLTPLCQQVEHAVSEVQKAQLAGAERQALLAKSEQQLEEEGARLRECDEALVGWKAEFEAVRDSLSLPDGLSAEAALVELKERSALQRKARDRDVCRSFRGDVLALLGDLGFEPEAERPDVWLRQAAEELAHAEQTEARRRQLLVRLERRHAEVEGAAGRLEAAVRERDDCLQPLVGTPFSPATDRVPDDAELQAFLAVYEQQLELQKQLGYVEDELRQAEVEGPGTGTAGDEEAGREQDPLAAEARLKVLPDEIRRASEAVQEASVARADAQRRLDELARERGAAEIELEIVQVRGELAEVAHRVRVLETAETLLRQRIDSYRREHQGPILRRASTAFERLTGGRFDGLDVDWDDDNRFVAVSSGPDGDRRRLVEALSSGTRDQLYLAIKVATIESLIESAKAPRMPCVFDDVLVHFDDKRTEHALSVLADLGQHTQVLVFTHHDHVRSLAKELSVPCHRL